MQIIQVLEKNQFNTGSVHQMFQAASGLRSRGHAVTIASREDAVLRSRAEQAGITFAPFPFRSEFDLRSILSLRRFLRAHPPDVIHVHKGLAHTVALAASWDRPAGAFVVNRGVSFPLTVWNRPKFTTGRVDRIVTVCDDIRNIVIETGHVPPEKVSTVYAGVDLEWFEPARWPAEPFRAEKGIPSSRFLIVQVGVRDWKGWKELIESFSDVAADNPQVHLALIACRSQEQKDDVLAFARSRGVGEKVTPVEARTDMPAIFAAADCVVDASWAGTGITGTIREAMAMRRPVLATDCGGNRELLNSADVGWLVPARNRARLTSALREVIGNPARASAVAGNARRRVEQGFSMEQRIDRLENLYREIVEGKARN